MQSPRRVNIGILLLAVWGVVFSMVFGIVQLRTELDQMVGVAIFQIMALGVPFFVYLLATKQSLREALPWRKMSWENTFVVILLSFAAIPFLSLISRVVALFFVPIISDLDVTASPVWFSILVIGIFPSLFEEFWFRGVMYKEYRAKGVPILKVALVTGLFFGIMHMNFQQAIYAGIFGILWAYLVHYTRSFLAPFIAHLISNGSSVLLSYNTAYVEWHSGLWERPLMYVLVAGLLSLAALPVIIFCMRHLKKDYEATEPAPQPVVEIVDAVPAEGVALPAPEKPKAFSWALWLALIIYVSMCLLLEFMLRLEWLLERLGIYPFYYVP